MPINKIKNDTIPDNEITAVKFHQNGATDGQALVWSNANGQWEPGAGGGGGGGMSDLVDDTSPQLGGDLDLLAKNIVGNGNIDINGHFHGTNIELETIEPTLQFKRLNNANVPAIKWLGQAGVEGANIKFDGTSGNANQLIFETYDSTTLAERFRINYDGVNVTGSLGVGTSTPNTELDVVGEISITNANGQRNGLYTNTNGQLVFFRNNFANATSTMIIDDETGNVGIGIEPGSPFHINLGTDKNIQYSGGIGEIGSVPGFQATNDASSGLRSMGMRATTLRFATGSDERMRIDENGNVGIGTDNPTAGKVAIDAGSTAIALHVTGSNTTDTRITIDNTSADADYTYLQLATSGAGEGDGYVVKNMEQGNGLPQGHLYLWTSGGTDNAISMVTNGDISKRATFNTDGSMTLRGVGGVEGHGMKLLATSEWTTGTAGAVFPVVDHSKYSAYQFYWVCDHAPNWFHTYLRMQDANGTVTSNIYNNNTSWKNCNSSGGTPDHNNSSYYGQRTHCWMAGNGTAYFSQGMGLISFEGSINRVLARGISQLSNRTGTDHYEESWSSAIDMVPSGVTGFTIYGSGGNSNRGYIKVFGIEK